MGQHYHHFSALERNTLQHQLNLGRSQAQIALLLDRSRSTVSREVRRNTVAASPASRTGLSPGLNYDACTASKASLARRRRGLLRLAEGSPLRAAVFRHIRIGWSPQQISGRFRLMEQPEFVFHETIYQAIYVLPKGELRRDLIGLLRQGRKLRHPRGQGKAKVLERRGALSDMVSIHQRPESVLTRQSAGDWEGGLIKGAGNASSVGTLVERKTRYTILTKMKNATADATLSSFTRGLSKVPETMLSSMTYDQGKEMARHVELAERLKIKVYFCDPHSPQEHSGQRPTNENTNGLIRQYLLKGINLSSYSQKDLDKIAESLNNRPRKVLGFRTPIEAYQTEISNQSVALQN